MENSQLETLRGTIIFESVTRNKKILPTLISAIDKIMSFKKKRLRKHIVRKYCMFRIFVG